MRHDVAVRRVAHRYDSDPACPSTLISGCLCPHYANSHGFRPPPRENEGTILRRSLPFKLFERGSDHLPPLASPACYAGRCARKHRFRVEAITSGNNRLPSRGRDQPVRATAAGVMNRNILQRRLAHGGDGKAGSAQTHRSKADLRKRSAVHKSPFTRWCRRPAEKLHGLSSKIKFLSAELTNRILQ